MNTELQTIDFDNFDNLAKFTGQRNFDQDAGLKFLKINTLPQDKAGNRLIQGSWELNIPGRGFVYAPEVLFRPFVRAMQYRRYSEKEKKTTSITKIFMNWSDEAYDTTGTIRCGRPRLKKGEEPTPAQQFVIDETGCYMLFFGLVTFTNPVDVTGATVEGRHTVPCLLRVRGNNFRIMSDLVELLTARRRDMLRTEVQLRLKMEVNGTAIYYNIVPTVDFTAPLVWDNDNDREGMKSFLNYIQEENRKIHDQYVAALNKGSVGTTRTIDATDTVSLVDDLADLPTDDSHTAGYKETKPTTKRNRTMAG